jgi:hypothetical protein
LVAAKRLLDPVIADHSSFNELALRGLDTEQVWEQIRLVSEQVKSVVQSRGGLKGNTKSGSVNGTKNIADEDIQSVGDEDELDDDSMDEDDEEESLDEDEEMEDEGEGDESDDNEFPINLERDEESADEDEETTAAKPFKKDIHGLNDEFFSIDDFNRLSEQQDAERSDDENADEIDYFAGPTAPVYLCADHKIPMSKTKKTMKTTSPMKSHTKISIFPLQMRLLVNANAPISKTRWISPKKTLSMMKPVQHVFTKTFLLKILPSTHLNLHYPPMQNEKPQSKHKSNN